jgi:hypothetical protein
MNMNILTVSEYNARQLVKYHERCSEWDSRKGGFPQIAFYLFFDKNGNERKKGFVLEYQNGAQCFARKKDAEAERQKKFQTA